MDNKHPSDLERLTALKVLREYAYLNAPVHYGLADFVEDIPAVRPYGMFAQDLVPSNTVFSRDSVKRHKQLREAVESVYKLHSKDSNLGEQTLRSGAAGALGSIPLSLLFGGITRGKGILNSFKNPAVRKELMNGLGEDVAHGVVYGGTLGAVVPLIASQVNPSRKSLSEASNILQNHPYMTGLPGADVIASLNYKKKESKPYRIVKSTAVGGLLGTLAGLSGGVINSGMDYATDALRKHVLHNQYVKPKFSIGKTKIPGLLGLGIGAASGLLTSSLNDGTQ